MQEQKGLDMVRRDWCPLSKDVGNFALREILSAKPKEDVVAAIHDHLNKVCKLFCQHISARQVLQYCCSAVPCLQAMSGVADSTATSL